MPPDLTTQQAADELSISRRRIQAMIVAGRLTATKRGRDWIIRAADLERVRVRQPGRPRTRPQAEAKPKKSRKAQRHRPTEPSPTDSGRATI